MTRVTTFFGSSLGKKVAMALSGVILFGFVIVHMLGNLQVYLGPVTFNGYAAGLRKVPELLWAARGVLLLAVLVHIWAAYTLTMLNRQARGTGYREKTHRESTLGSRTMRWTGVLVLFFIVYHLLHFTFGTAHPDFREGDAFHNFVTGFQSPLVSAAYIVAMLCLALHLYHGAWSWLQTLGLSHPRYNGTRRTLALLFTAAIVIANISFPIAVMAGLVHESAPQSASAGTPR
jgi:succinate dehydrogenase / fumarate reductase cytochrome b subunit